MVRIRVMVRISVKATKCGHFYTHFDDLQMVLQTMQTVDERVIN